MDTGELTAWAAVAAQLRARAGAERVVLLLDTGAIPALIDCDATVEVTVGDDVGTLDGEAVAAADPPIVVPNAVAPPSLQVSADRDEVIAPMGVVAGLAVAVRELAAGLPGASVATVQWDAGDPAAPFSITARAGEPLVLGIGEQAYPMGVGWPDGGG